MLMSWRGSTISHVLRSILAVPWPGAQDFGRPFGAVSCIRPTANRRMFCAIAFDCCGSEAALKLQVIVPKKAAAAGTDVATVAIGGDPQPHWVVRSIETNLSSNTILKLFNCMNAYANMHSKIAHHVCRHT